MSELYRDFIEDQFDRVVNAINNELPAPTQADIGKVVQVASDGGSGAEYVLDAVPNELPTPTTSDIDKVVKVISDGSGGAEYSLDSVPQELPTPASTNLGKVATVVSDGSGGYEWGAEAVPSELPTPTTADIGKFATVVSDGGTGAEYALGTISKISNSNIPTMAIMSGAGNIINVSFTNTNRADLFELVKDNNTITPFEVDIQGFDSTWSKHYAGRGIYYGYDAEAQLVIFKGEFLMSGTSDYYAVTYKMHKTDATKDVYTETVI